MAKNNIKVTANVVDTAQATVAGADKHPGWHAVRKVAARITTPLLPDDYLQLANPLWSARELRGRVLEVRRETEDSATLVIKPGWGFHFDYDEESERWMCDKSEEQLGEMLERIVKQQAGAEFDFEGL